jgi:predicted chitinase
MRGGGFPTGMINCFVPGSSLENEAKMGSAEVLTTLILCGFLGALGQGVRAAVGLKSAATLAAQNPSQRTEFDVAYFTLSLMIGFTAGILAGLAIGLENFAKIDPNDPKSLLAIVAAGYAGTDFIENVFTNLVPKISTPPQIPAGKEVSRPADKAPSKRYLKSIPLPSREREVPSYVQTIDNEDLRAALKVVAPRVNLSIWIPALSSAFLKFDLTTDRRIAAAIGQFLVEAGDSFQELTEDLDYTSAAQIAEVYPREFPTAEDAEPFVRRPEAFADRVYANKLGNRGEASGDGWTFRGRGLIQITGRDDYTEFGSTLGMTAEEAAAYCEQPVGAAMSGCWYLASRGALVRADHWLISEITRLVNGPAMRNAGLRLEYSDAMLKALGGSSQA